MKYYMLLLIVCSIISCSKNEQLDSFLNCEEIAESFKAYKGEDITCQFHYVLSEYDNQQFIELIAHCADLSRPYVFNSNCIDICEIAPNIENTECITYLMDRVTKEILLIEK